ncbi:MAG: hypothetical protein ACMUEL_03195 [Flavobacteriales bacterium Tduv]
MLRSTAQINFTELYMEYSTRRSEFFKRLNTMTHWDGIEQEVKE